MSVRDRPETIIPRGERPSWFESDAGRMAVSKAASLVEDAEERGIAVRYYTAFVAGDGSEANPWRVRYIKEGGRRSQFQTHKTFAGACRASAGFNLGTPSARPAPVGMNARYVVVVDARSVVDADALPVGFWRKLGPP